MNLLTTHTDAIAGSRWGAPQLMHPCGSQGSVRVYDLRFFNHARKLPITPSPVCHLKLHLEGGPETSL